MAIAALGDWNADGRDDFAVSAPIDDSIYVYPPLASAGPMVSGNLSAAPQILRATGQAGMSLAGVGDVTEDGYPDLAVGAPAYAGSDRGAVLIYAGGNGTSTEPLITLAGTCSDESRCLREGVGMSLASLGDMNADGKPDFAVGSLFGGGAAGAVARGRILLFMSNAIGGTTMLMSGSVESAQVKILGEDQAGMCAVLPGGSGQLPATF